MARFADHADFGPTIDAVAERLGISPTAVEKDFWVTQVLRILAQDFAGDFVFKGGTSLAKGYRLLERFSEDIDILVLPGVRGRTSTDRLMKAMAERAALGVGGSASTFGTSETGRHRSYEIHYPATRHSTGLISTRVLLEMGIRGDPNPHSPAPVDSLLGEALRNAGSNVDEFDDFIPFEVETLHPGRTLLEKLVLVHKVTQELTADPQMILEQRTGRHFYDIYLLLGDRHVLNFLANWDQVEEILRSVTAVNQEFFGGNANDIRSLEDLTSCQAFDPSNAVSVRLRDSYESTMPDLYFGHASLPRWEEICSRVSENRLGN
jgi:hypothetical protein